MRFIFSKAGHWPKIMVGLNMKIKCFWFSREVCNEEVPIQGLFMMIEALFVFVSGFWIWFLSIFSIKNLEYVKQKIGELHLDQGQQINQKTIDHKNPNSRLKKDVMRVRWDLNPWRSA